jgi:Ser/Thr protein kinase RdoA (MazF antagonist)
MGEGRSQQVFPVIYSTLCSQALITLVQQEYEIQEIEACEFWNRGLSDIYLITTSTALYILRISHCHWRSQSEIQFELEFLDFLQQRQLPVAVPLPTKQDQLFIEIEAPEGKRYLSLFTYAAGEVALGDLNPTQSYTLGNTLAQIHQTSLDFHSPVSRPPLDLSFLVDNSLETIIPFFQHRHQDLDYLLEAGSQIKQTLQDLPQTDPYWVVCWGDPHSGNVHFTPEGDLTLFDFDQCGYSWRAFDIGKFLQIAIRTGINRRVRESFMQGYETVWQLTEAEKVALPGFTQTAHLWSWAIHLNTSVRFNYACLDNLYSSRRLAQLKRLKSPDWELF